MKIMSRDFTLPEKILLLVLALILLGLVYYWFVDQTVRSSITASNIEAESIQTQMDAVEQRILYLQSLRNSMDELEDAGNLSWMGSYNNSKAEVAFLNDILADTQEYSIAFAAVTRNGDQIRRNFTLQFQTRNYKAAQDIIVRLCSGTDRCLVGDIKCSIAKDRKVTTSASATFFETMVGGTPDAGLPADSASVNQ